MKKTLALFLALVTILSIALVACKSNTPPVSSNDADDDVWADRANTSETSTDTNNSSTIKGDWQQSSVSKVYAMWKIVFRSAADTTDSSKISELPSGTEFVVVAESKDTNDITDKPLWYKVTYGEQEGYVSGDWVSSNVDDTVFEDCTPETLIIKNSNESKPHQVNIRHYPAVTTKTSAATLTHEEATSSGELQKVGQSKSGLWFKVTYDLDKSGSIDTDEIFYIKMTNTIRTYFNLPSIGVNGSDAQG